MAWHLASKSQVRLNRKMHVHISPPPLCNTPPPPPLRTHLPRQDGLELGLCHAGPGQHPLALHLGGGRHDGHTVRLRLHARLVQQRHVQDHQGSAGGCGLRHGGSKK